MNCRALTGSSRRQRTNVVLGPLLLAVAVSAAVSPTTARAAGTPWTGWVSSPVSSTSLLAVDGGLLPAAPSTAAATAWITVDPGTTGSRWRGVGGSLTDSAVQLLTSYPAAEQQLFGSGTAASGRLNLLRLPLSSTDFSSRSWTWSWNTSTQQATPTAEALAAVKIISAIRTAQPALTVIATPWSAPAAMKTSGSIKGGALKVGSEQSYADLLVAQALWLVQHNVPLVAVTLGNEPGFSTSEYASMTMTDSQMVTLAKSVRPRLPAGVQLWAWEHNWDGYTRAQNLIQGAPGSFQASAFHCYGGDPAQMASVSGQKVMTECTGTTDGLSSTLGWDAKQLIVGPLKANSTGLLMWNLALDPNHGPKAAGGCTDCRGLVTIDPATGLRTMNPEFYTLAHVARAADPGARFLPKTTASSSALTAAAFLDPDGTVGVVGFNQSWAVQVISVQITGGGERRFSIAPRSMFTFRGTP